MKKKKKENTKDIALVYLVAGISSRFKGKIKAFAKISKKETLIEYSLNQALKVGFSKIIFVVGNKTEKPFKKKFGKSYKRVPVFYALQSYDEKVRDKPWGTADAVCSAKLFLDCNFVICNGDDIYGEKTFKILVKHLKRSNEEATIGYKLSEVLPETGAVNRGIFQYNGGYVKNFKEVLGIVKSNLKATNRKPNDLCSMGIFAFHPETLKFLGNRVKKFKKKHKGDRKIECLLPDELSELIKAGKIKMRIYLATEKWFGITYPKDERIVREMIKDFHQKSIKKV